MTVNINDITSLYVWNYSKIGIDIIDYVLEYMKDKFLKHNIGFINKKDNDIIKTKFDYTYSNKFKNLHEFRHFCIDTHKHTFISTAMRKVTDLNINGLMNLYYLDKCSYNLICFNKDDHACACISCRNNIDKKI